jgi:hypothetical protein
MKHTYRIALAIACTAAILGTAAADPGPEPVDAGTLEEVVVLAKRVRPIPAELMATRAGIEEIVVTGSRIRAPALRAETPLAATAHSGDSRWSPL